MPKFYYVDEEDVIKITRELQETLNLESKIALKERVRHVISMLPEVDPARLHPQLKKFVDMGFQLGWQNTAWALEHQSTGLSLVVPKNMSVNKVRNVEKIVVFHKAIRVFAKGPGMAGMIETQISNEVYDAIHEYQDWIRERLGIK